MSSINVWVPPGWPEQVRPPGSQDWEATASAFLFDCCPPDFRGYAVLRRHPVVLARFAVQFVDGQCETVQKGVALIRTQLNGTVAPEVVTAAADAWLEQGAALVRTRRAVGLVADALDGEVFVPRL